MVNRQVLLLRSISENSRITQRALCADTGLALGTVNSLMRALLVDGFIKKTDEGLKVTEEGFKLLEPYRVDCAVLMAAGFGSRFVPLSFEKPKGLLEVFGEPMAERQIKQLHEVGVTDIAVIVGYMKEKFEYLTDKYGVTLIYNDQYAVKNNISSIAAAYDFLKGRNAYILSSDNWIRNNMFHRYEAFSWYSAKHADGPTSEWTLVSDKKGRITDTYPGGRDCDYMYGPAYFSREFSDVFLPVLMRFCEMSGTENYYWEHVLMGCLNGTAKKRIKAYFGTVAELKFCDELEMYVNLQPEDNVYEFENLEELRLFDSRYMDNSGSRAMQAVSRIFEIPESGIENIRRLKAGMTNNSWLFSTGGRSYICRIPGEGTELLINRRQEKAVLDAVSGLGITEKVIYFNADNGFKISEYYENSRNSNPKSPEDMRCCMQLLKRLHDSGVRVEHDFDIEERIGFYEGLCDDIPFSDYKELKPRAAALIEWLKVREGRRVLAHIDSVADNFIFLPGAEGDKEARVSAVTGGSGAESSTIGNGRSETGGSGAAGIAAERDISLLRLIDWEYAGMCDPMIDIAMCAIYSYMDEKGAKQLLEFYLGREPYEEEMTKVYAYMALGGLLWALWGVYKEQLGVDFSDYTIKMYRYFKKYSAYVLK